jgi:hypothetical protein
MVQLLLPAAGPWVAGVVADRVCHAPIIPQGEDQEMVANHRSE